METIEIKFVRTSRAFRMLAGNSDQYIMHVNGSVFGMVTTKAWGLAAWLEDKKSYELTFSKVDLSRYKAYCERECDCSPCIDAYAGVPAILRVAKAIGLDLKITTE